jgi:hypothetical protein
MRYLHKKLLHKRSLYKGYMHKKLKYYRLIVKFSVKDYYRNKL